MDELVSGFHFNKYRLCRVHLFHSALAYQKIVSLIFQSIEKDLGVGLSSKNKNTDL